MGTVSIDCVMVSIIFSCPTYLQGRCSNHRSCLGKSCMGGRKAGVCIATSIKQANT